MPITFGMTPNDAMALLLSVYIGGMSGGLISAILLNIPARPLHRDLTGRPSNGDEGTGGQSAWRRDSHQLYRRHAKLWAADVDFAHLGQLCAEIRPFEYFLWCIFPHADRSVLGGSIIKSLAAAFLGMCLSYIGMDPFSSVPRLTFGLFDLETGIECISLMIGMFAIPS
jgi:putative tricarboxylic transport membrane protein